MALKDKEEAIGQMSRAIRGLDTAIDKLDKALVFALVPEKRRIFKLLTALEERLVLARAFIRHLQAADVVVAPPKATSYRQLERALKALQAIQVANGAVARVLAAAAALGDAVLDTRTEVSGRAT